AEDTERWMIAGRVTQVRRVLVYSDFQVDDPAFEAGRQAARASDGTMTRQTVEGLRYFNKQKDGTRKVEERARSSGRAVGGLVLVDPTLSFPVVPLAGFAYYDFNAFN